MKDEFTGPPRRRSAAAALDLASIRRRLSSLSGRQYWRSLEELAGTEDFLDYLHHEFPRLAVLWDGAVDRRQFLKLMGASLALAGLGACARPPEEQVVPYAHAPDAIVPGEPLYFATAFSLEGMGAGVLVKSNMGRPTKIEGNPEHPASLGATDAFAQASVLTLYDPDRSQVTTHLGNIGPWSDFTATIRTVLEAQRELQGAGLRILSGTVTSPTLADQLQGLLKKLPKARWHQYEPVGRDNARAGALAAFGTYTDTQYHLDKADVVLALDADFLTCGPASLRHVRDFSARRRIERTHGTMSRLYVVECTPSNTGAMADHRLPLRASEIDGVARAVAAGLGLAVQAPAGSAAYAAWIAALVRDLQQHRGSSLVIAGDQQPPAVHVLAHAMNHHLGTVGTTVVYTDPVEARPQDQLASLVDLVNDIDAGAVDALLILGGNPVYDAPADLRFGERLQQITLRIHLSLYQDETSALCHWHIPQTHDLESWSDVRAYDGTVTIVQPLIAPLYETKTAHQVLAAFAGSSDASGYDLVRAYWKGRYTGADFEQFWRQAVHDGVVRDTALPPKPVALKPDCLATLPPPTSSPESLELVFRPDPTTFDGRFANNAWLQELPKPITKLTWDNAVLVAPATAERLDLHNEEVVELEYDGRRVRGPIWITPGHATDCVTVTLGYGRTLAGRVGSNTGFNAYAVRASSARWFGGGLQLRKTGAHRALACTQHHHSMEGRDLVQFATLAEYHANPEFARAKSEPDSGATSLYPGFQYDGHAWGMAIDLNSCVGCNACVVACQAENNIPSVGKDEVARGREMHWLRIDRYYTGDLGNPQTFYEPVPCMHCENAPCELVCPVGATVHSSEGLNEMVYNRCVGTRYCSNNCPYKVRRFNFFQYSNRTVETLKMVENPEVTVRSRGVMEKCTYCVQRILAGRITAEKEDRRVRDGDVVTACQAACPAEAIVFGDINDKDSRVTALKAQPRHYGLLTELNTRPRTTYLAALRNPNKEIV